MWVLVALAGIGWLASSTYLENDRKRVRDGGGDVGALADLSRRLDAAEADRARLVARVEALEAIAASDADDLDRALRSAVAVPPAGARLTLPDEAENSDAPAQTGRRVRG